MSIFYVIFILLTAYYSFRYDRIEEYDSHKQHRLWLMCIYLICLSGFSYGLGADKFVYMEEFEEYSHSMTDFGYTVLYNLVIKSQMPLWTFVNMFAKTTIDSFYVVQFIESTCINIAVCYLVSKYTHRYFLFLLIYFFSLQYFILNTEIMREGFSLSLVTIGMHKWLNGKKWYLYACVAIGILFHVSAAIALLFPLSKIKPTLWKLGAACVLSFFIWVTSDILLVRIVGAFLGESDAFSTKIMYYSIQASTFFGYARSLLTYLIFPFIVVYSVILHETNEQIKRAFSHFASFVLILGIVASSFAGFYRFYNYVIIFYLIAFAEFTYSLLRYKEHFAIRIATFFGKGLLTFFFLYQAHYASTNTHFYDFFYPYTCILDENKKAVEFRKIAHKEGATIEFNDNNMRNVK